MVFRVPTLYYRITAAPRCVIIYENNIVARTLELNYLRVCDCARRHWSRKQKKKTNKNSAQSILFLLVPERERNIL